MRARQKNWQLLLLCLVALTLIAFFANVPMVEAQSSARLRLIQSDTSRITLELEVSGYDSRDVTVSGATYTLFSIGDLVRTGEPGKPQLPVKGTMIGIPPGSQPTLRIVDPKKLRFWLSEPATVTLFVNGKRVVKVEPKGAFSVPRNFPVQTVSGIAVDAAGNVSPMVRAP